MLAPLAASGQGIVPMPPPSWNQGEKMLRLLLLLLIAGITAMKLFSFRHLREDDPTVSLYFGGWTGGGNIVVGDLPPGEPILLARGEGGFEFEAFYMAAMEFAWFIVAAAVIGILLLGILRPRYGVRY